MLCVRITVFLLLLLGTAALTASVFFPQFTKTGTWSYYFWFKETKTEEIASVVLSRISPWNYPCSQESLFYTVTVVFSTAGAAFGFFAVLLAIMHMTVSTKGCCCVGIVLIAFLSFGCALACVIALALSYTQKQCGGTVYAMEGLKTQGYAIAPGFGLTCASCGLFLFAMVLEFCS